MKIGMRWGVLLLGAFLALVTMPKTTKAQDSEPIVPATWSVKLGVFMPSNGNAKRAGTSTWWAMGVDYNCPTRMKPLNAEIHLGVDVNTHGDATIVPVTVKMIWPFHTADSPFRAYVGLGAGLYFTNFPHGGNTVQPGVKAIVGVDISKKMFIEANYDYAAGFSNNLGQGLRADGLTAAVGVRF